MAFAQYFVVETPTEAVRVSLIAASGKQIIGVDLKSLNQITDDDLAHAYKWAREHAEQLLLYCHVDPILSEEAAFVSADGNRQLDTLINDEQLRQYKKLPWLTSEQIALAEAAEAIKAGLAKSRSQRPRGGQWISEAGRTALYERDAYRCRYCGAHKELCLDHVVPHSRGGSDESSNLVTCCGPCNRYKYNRTPEEAGMTLRPVPQQ